ncbi:MAG: redox-regulated ATPase YchF [Lentisphaerae bacterium]|nr:redox-regulated ATPase YchF [Lentisphaerota bacterium]
MKISILGLASSGKKTLFSLLTQRSVPEGLKPDEPIEGCAMIKDEKVDVIAKFVQPAKITYAENRFVLCPDVNSDSNSRGWLDPARKCDLTCVLVREFYDENVYHPAGVVDAERDRQYMEAEILLADLELVEKRLDRLGKEKRAGQTPMQILEEKTLRKCTEALENEKRLSELGLETHELDTVRSLGLLSLKPILWVRNVDEKSLGENTSKDVPVSCKIEREIMEIANAAERTEYLAELGVNASGIDRVNKAAYDALGLMSFYTMGKDEVRAWTIRKGSTAPIAAGKVHSDMERGFIRVEIIKYDDLVTYGSETAIKQHGKTLLKGKDYIIEDGDICSFLFNV